MRERGIPPEGTSELEKRSKPLARDQEGEGQRTKGTSPNVDKLHSGLGSSNLVFIDSLLASAIHGLAPNHYVGYVAWLYGCSLQKEARWDMPPLGAQSPI